MTLLPAFARKLPASRGEALRLWRKADMFVLPHDTALARRVGTVVNRVVFQTVGIHEATIETERGFLTVRFRQRPYYGRGEWFSAGYTLKAKSE